MAFSESVSMRGMARCMICCQQFVLDCQRREEVRFVANNLCLIIKDVKKYDVLSPMYA